MTSCNLAPNTAIFQPNTTRPRVALSVDRQRSGRIEGALRSFIHIFRPMYRRVRFEQKVQNLSRTGGIQGAEFTQLRFSAAGQLGIGVGRARSVSLPSRREARHASRSTPILAVAISQGRVRMKLGSLSKETLPRSRRKNTRISFSAMDQTMSRTSPRCGVDPGSRKLVTRSPVSCPPRGPEVRSGLCTSVRTPRKYRANEALLPPGLGGIPHAAADCLYMPEIRARSPRRTSARDIGTCYLRRNDAWECSYRCLSCRRLHLIQAPQVECRYRHHVASAIQELCERTSSR